MLYLHMVTRKTRALGLRCLFAMLVLIAVLGSGSPARADVGVPPWALRPAALTHGEGGTRVAMLAEDVLIEIEEQESPDVFLYANERYAASELISHVEAVFRMRNTGDADEAFDVWFPLWLPNYPWGAQVVPVQAFRVWVDGREVPVQGLTLDANNGMALEEGQPWAVWPVVFPAGEDVAIRVTYDAYPTDELPYAVFGYILETGADWAGPIGSGQITFVLPYDVDELNVIPPAGEVTIDANEIVVSFREVEPTEEDNLSMVMLAPGPWREVAAAREGVAADPGSSLAQLRYAHASMLAVRVMKDYALTGGLNPVHAEAAVAAFETALSINADAFMVHDAVSYLSLLSYLRAYEAWEPPEELLALLARALERQPGAYLEVVDYVQMLAFKWEREFWTEEDGTEHVPGQPSDALLALVAQLVELSPEPIDQFPRWVTWASEGRPTAEPTLDVGTSVTTPTPHIPGADGETGEIEPGPEAAGSRFCPGLIGLVILPLAIYTRGRKPLTSRKMDETSMC